MATLTITEALAEINVLKKRIQKKKDDVGQNVVRHSRIVDNREGGSDKYVGEQMQAISDLEARTVRIVSSIQEANLANELSVQLEDGKPIIKTVTEWLAWRKHVAPERKAFLSRLRTGIVNKRTEIERDASREDGDSLIVNLDEDALTKEDENLEFILGRLDGLLSVNNATTTLEV